MNDYNFGNFVCALREKHGLTQADIAKQLGVTPAAVSKWENGSSKPRVEVLFQLAEILDVRPEELMAGQYIEEEHLDPDSVKLINEKYEYLRRIELHNTATTKILRFIGALIDWLLTGLVVIFTVLCLVNPQNDSLSTHQALFVLPFMISYPICFVLRDLIFHGRSLGKRMMGLTVIDKQTGETPKKSALLMRNIFIFVIPIDTVIMLVTGLTLGDRAAHTVVVRKNGLVLTQNGDFTENNTEIINRYASLQTEHVKSNKKQKVIWIIIIITTVLVMVAVVLNSIRDSLNKITETEQYKLAYAYLVESDEFKKLGIEEDKIKFNSYSIQTDDESHKYAKIVFKTGGMNEITIVLHDAGDGWYVCEECTGFK